MLENGARATDPQRLFQEAVSIYVGRRVNTFYGALRGLRALACDQGVNLLGVEERIGGIEKAYNLDAGMPARGYQGKEQAHTTRDISPEMRVFLDNEILEGKIPYSFDEVDRFLVFEKAALERAHRAMP